MSILLAPRISGQAFAHFSAVLRHSLVLTLAITASGQVSRVLTNQRPRNADPNVQFVGSDKCKLCHFAIYNTYSRTEMSRSTSLPVQAINAGWLTTPAEFSSPGTNRHYKVFSRGTKVFETESELDPNGREIFNHTEELAYIVGDCAPHREWHL